MQAIKEGTIKTSMNLDRDLWRRVRVRAAGEDTSATQIVERALEEYLKNGRK